MYVDVAEGLYNANHGILISLDPASCVFIPVHQAILIYPSIQPEQD
jgi:hypothetical protein